VLCCAVPAWVCAWLCLWRNGPHLMHVFAHASPASVVTLCVDRCFLRTRARVAVAGWPASRWRRAQAAPPCAQARAGVSTHPSPLAADRVLHACGDGARAQVRAAAPAAVAHVRRPTHHSTACVRCVWTERVVCCAAVRHSAQRGSAAGGAVACCACLKLARGRTGGVPERLYSSGTHSACLQPTADGVQGVRGQGKDAAEVRDAGCSQLV
jgi:hypothetical protein